MIQLSLAKFQADLSAAALEALRAEFAEFHTFQIRQFIHPSLLEFVLDRLRPEDFKPRPHGKIGSELAVDTLTNLAVQSLQLRMNDAALAQFMEKVTGVCPVKHFEGRVYRMMPGPEHFDSWHDDICEGREIGVSINLSPAPYRGGLFSIKHQGSDQALRCMPNLGPGDAIFFRIHPDLKHMVTGVQGTVGKTAYAGWFHNVALLTDYLKPRPTTPPSSKSHP
jgi:hypothetical protein